MKCQIEFKYRTKFMKFIHSDQVTISIKQNTFRMIYCGK